MNLPQIILPSFGVLLIAIGLLQQQKGFAEWNIRWANSLKGVKTQITKQSLAAQKVTGVVFVILGISMLVMAFVVIPSTTASIYNP